jgi:indolepyruvate ferredoxin oxidoreductase beta subunit
VTNSTPLVNISDYPETEELLNALESLPHKVVFDVDKIAKEVGSIRVANMVMLGAATPFLGIAYDEIENGIRRIFERKGPDIVQLNLKALAAGKKIADESIRI